MSEHSAEKDVPEIARLRELARDLDAYSFSINDGYVGRVAAEMETLAEKLSRVIPPGKSDG